MEKIFLKTTEPVIPKCYAYTTPNISTNEGYTKIGYTEREVEKRIKEQTQTVGAEYILHWAKTAMFEASNKTFTDKEFHGFLTRSGVERKGTSEWFHISPEDADIKFNDFRTNKGIITTSSKDPIPYKLREEQEEAVLKTKEYFDTHQEGEFLWNAKPRFGKTLSSYDLCLRMGFQNILVVTNRPAIGNSWYEDYEKFIGINSGYYFVSHVEALRNEPYVVNREEYLEILTEKPEIKGCIQFVSLQDLKSSVYFGGEYDKLRELSKDYGITWDILIIDEAHEGVDTYKTDVAFEQIERRNTLHLSGTPFKALANAKFPEEAIFNWTYADEQKKKREWDTSQEEENPYEVLPQLNLYTYKMSDIIQDKIEDGIDIEGKTEEFTFDLNEFFSTNGRGSFIYDNEVDQFLDALTTKEKFPFSTEELRNEIKHSFWMLERVDSARALARKLQNNPIFKEYKIILAAGDGRLEEDEKALVESYDKVTEAIKKYDKTITLSVRQLTTGVTIPEWTAVLMLRNMKSPSLYMQAAFRSQNPCLFKDGLETFRKENSYVFDFDPARTLTIFEEFANDLYPSTSGGRGDSKTREKQIRELLNFFPVYAEDPEGSMVLLDAEKVMTIPRRIHAVEVVNRGFMSNFLFANISNIFKAPSVVQDILNRIEPSKEFYNLKDIEMDDDIAEELNLDDNNEISIPKEQIIGKATEVFGEKIRGEIIEKASELVKETEEDPYDANRSKTKKKFEELKENVSKNVSSSLVEVAKNSYQNELNSATEKRLEENIKNSTSRVIDKKISQWEIDLNVDESHRKKELNEAKSSEEQSEINKKFDNLATEKSNSLLEDIQRTLQDPEFFKESEKLIVETVETEKKREEKKTKETEIRDHLRGFARTIPLFLMAYGSDETTLENFDQIVPDEVFQEVTSISLDQFRFLRDGGEYKDPYSGEMKIFEGHLFDELVFNDSVKEFLNKKKELSNYFDEDLKRNIFDYIPPQKTNLIFTPKKVVKEMVDLLEEESPGCFDDPEKTFADLYLKSGLYLAEIVKRLFNSKKMQKEFPEEEERLNHIFSRQIYGLSPSKIIHQIVLNFLLGFREDIDIKKHNLRQLDSLKAIQEGHFEEELEKIFDD